MCWGEQAYNAVEENLQSLLVFVSDHCLFFHYHLFPILLVITVQALYELLTALHAPGLCAPPRKIATDNNISANGKHSTH